MGYNVLKYYWVKSVDYSGNVSAFSSMASATTLFVDTDSFSQAVNDLFSDAGAYGIEPVSSLPASGDFNGQIKYLTTQNKLYRWDSSTSAWTDDIFSITSGSVDAASFASGIEPISIVSSLPNPSGYTGTQLVFLTTDSKLYRYNGTAFVASILSGDISGTLGSDLFPNNLRPVEIVSTLPTTGNFQGRQVFLTSDNKLYRYNGTSFIASVATSDLQGQVSSTQISDNSISTAKIQADAITANEIDAGAITANALDVGAINSAAIATGAIIAGKIDSNAITTGAIQAGAVKADQIDSQAITSVKIKAEAIQTSHIAANQITGGLIAASGVITDTAQISNGVIESANIDNLAVTQGKIANLAVDTLKIADNAVYTVEMFDTSVNIALPRVYSTSSSTINSTAWNTVNQFTFDFTDAKSGQTVLFFDCGAAITIFDSSPPNNPVHDYVWRQTRLLRNGTAIYTASVIETKNPLGTFNAGDADEYIRDTMSAGAGVPELFFDTPPAGNLTYTLQSRIVMDSRYSSATVTQTSKSAVVTGGKT